MDLLRAEGGHPYLVGGAVRDAFLGVPMKDLDLEVHGLAGERLSAVLGAHFRVDAVGSAFTVYKVSGLEGVTGAVDVSLPRRVRFPQELKMDLSGALSVKSGPEYQGSAGW